MLFSVEYVQIGPKYSSLFLSSVLKGQLVYLCDSVYECLYSSICELAVISVHCKLQYINEHLFFALLVCNWNTETWICVSILASVSVWLCMRFPESVTPRPPCFSLALCFFSSLSSLSNLGNLILSASAHSLPLMLHSASVWCKNPVMTSFKTAEVFKKLQFKNRSSSWHTYVMPNSCIMLQKKIYS